MPASTPDMPLQNRVSPWGKLVATPERGGMMGNRGILHDRQRRLGVSRWKHPHWVCCLLAFRGRRRSVMTPGRYTELFFLDEATALAAGHRPSAPSLDRLLHPQRVTRRREQVRYRAALDALPDGTMVLLRDDEASAWLVWRDRLWRWSFGGYGVARPRGSASAGTVLTPRPIVRTLAAGYRPSIHASADSRM